MAIPKRPEPLDPQVERAAEAGDVAAMRHVGIHRYESGENAASEKWLLAAAQAGDAEAMYTLSRVHHDRAVSAGLHGKASDVTAASWCRRAAEAGSVDAIRAMRSWAEPDEREFWLRKAVETGDPYAASGLGALLDREGRTAEAEEWHRRAAREPGYHGHKARHELANFLVGQRRLEEAAACLMQNAEEGDSSAARYLGDIYEWLGRADEARSWRLRADVLRAAEPEPNPER
ncbi:hypothetical protein [Streptomyces sp. NPDC048606]|uniref:hypothetical protein n=1 Tax=Streptomyces sp. NPDC048606 TaxID=3154726 RepID=UPI0034366B57